MHINTLYSILYILIVTYYGTLKMHKDTQYTETNTHLQGKLLTIVV